MLTLLKKKTDQGGAAMAPAWHPNFRNYADLPDTKVVRTAFFINFAAILFAAAMLTYLVFQEYRIWTINSQIQTWDTQISAVQKPSREAVALYKKFKEEESKLKELDDFVKQQRISVPEFIAQIGATLPENIGLTATDFRDTEVKLYGFVRGAPDQASGIASGYEKQLREQVSAKQIFESVTLTNITRDAQTNLLIFELTLKYRAPATGTKRK